MAIEGTLDEFRLPDILQLVAHQRKTGILTVQGESTIVAVSFLAGAIVAADSLEETVEERLGVVLVREGLLSRQEYSQVIERQRQGQGRLIDLLVEGGHLGRAQVLDSLRLQTRELLANLLAWNSGEFKFYGNDEVAYEEGFQPLAVDELLLSLLPDEEEEVAAPAAAATHQTASGHATASGHEPASPATDGAAEEPLAAVVSMPTVPPRAPTPTVRWDDEPTLNEVFVPPEDAARPGAVARSSAAADPLLWLPMVFAALLAAVVLLALPHDPARFLLPLPWQTAQRDAYRATQRQAAYQSIDRAAKTFFLIEGRFPDSLDRLVELSLLDDDDRTDPAGSLLRLTPHEDSYELRPMAVGSAEAPPASVEAITGNFLLDPEYLTAPQDDKVPPLVLLD